MKKKLLFTAVVVAAMSGAMVPVLALQNAAETEAGFMAGEAGEEDEAVYTDVTANLVVNASCTEGHGWTKDSKNASASYNVNNNQLNSSDYSGVGIEFWTGSDAPARDCDLIFQDITGLPNGTYRLTAVAMGRNQAPGKNNICDTGLYLFANASETQVTSNVWGKISTTVEVTENKLRIGLRAKSDNNNNWLAISQVVLEYQGTETEYYQQALPAKVDYVHKLGSQYEANGDVPKFYSDQLKNYQAASCTEISQYQEEIKKIDDMITSIINDVKNPFYVAYKSTEDYANNVLIDALEGTDESAKGTLRSAIASAREKAVSKDDKAVWKEAKMELEQACKAYYEASSGIKSEVKDFDVTRLLVKNAGFEYENPLEGWDGLNEADIYTDETYHMVRKGGQYWRVLQTMEVPNGLYYMSVQIGFAQSDRNQIFLESSYQRATTLFKWTGAATDEDILASWSKDDEAQRSRVANVLVTDGKITMGVEWIKDNETMKFDNFRLIRVSDGAEEIEALYEQKKSEAKAFNMDLLLNVFREPLENALSMPVTTLDEYYAAYNAMKKAVEDCNSSMQATSTIVNLINECQSYHDNSIATDEAKDILLAKIDESKNYKESKTIEELQQYIEPLETVRREFVEQAIPTGNVKFDITYKLTNPDLSSLPSWTKQDGWYTDTDKSIQCMHNGEVASSDGKDAFYEIYAGSKTPMPEGNILYQKLVLEPGIYRMTAYAYGKGVNDNYTGDFSGNFFAGEVKGDAVTAQNLTEGGVNFSLSKEEEIKLGLYSDGTGKANWAGIGYMKLYKLAPETLTLDEESADYNVEADTYTNVTVDRVLKADGKWNTFCVPFAMTAEQLAENKIKEVRKLESVTKNGESVVLNFSDPVTEIEAGVPYIVKAGEQVSQIIVNGVVVRAAAPEPLTVDNVVMEGNYASMTITGDNYFISDNKFYRAADKTITVNGFRAYITFSDAQAAGINTMFINIDGEVTAIDEAVEDVSDELVNVYTMNGVCVKAGVKASEALNGLQRGAYIVNGKKVIK